MHGTYEIRICDETDIKRTSQFYDRVIRWLVEHVNYPRWKYGIYPSEDSVREMTETGTQYICTKDGTVIGAFVLNREPSGSYHKGNWSKDLAPGSYMVIHTLAVDPSMERQGLATEVIRFCIEKAKKEGCKALRADIVPENTPSRKLFEKNGFSYAGDTDLELGLEDIPLFSLYEMNL